MNNADRIRNMTDEEIADLFTDDITGDSTFSCPVFRTSCVGVDCRECLLDWLKQEVTP